MTPAIETTDLTKHFGEVCAAESIGLRVEAGELFGFLGPNGAGKTTTIRMLLDLLRPDRGHARILGIPVRGAGFQLAPRLGYAPSEVDLYPELTGTRLLDAFSAMRSRGAPVLRDAVLAMLDLSGRDLKRKVREYSTGMKRKMVLALAMQHDPDLLILDEPTWGLDPLRQRALLDFLRERSREGRTVFFSSHQLSEVESICDRVGIVNQGRLVAQERIDDLRGRHVRRVEVTLAADSPAPEFASNGLEVEAHEGCRWVIRVHGQYDRLIQVLAGCRVKDLVAGPPRLEELFFAYYREEER